MEFVEAKQPGLLRDRGGGQPDRILAADFAQFRFLPQGVDALVHVGHEFMEMDAALAHDRRGREEQVHQHGLAAADLAENVKALDRFRLVCARAEQPAERGRLAREMTLGEPLFELRKLVDDRLLGAVAFDLSSGDARRILHRDGSRHERGWSLESCCDE